MKNEKDYEPEEKVYIYCGFTQVETLISYDNIIDNSIKKTLV